MESQSQGLEHVFTRNQFYGDNYRRISLIFLLLILCTVLLSGFVLYQRLTFPSPKYIGTTPDGRPIPIIPLSNPYQSPDFVLAWGVRAVTEIYALDFVTWRKSIQDAEVYFTPKGYNDFMVALKESSNIQALIERKQIVSATITATPILIRQGIESGDVVYSWNLQIPVTITYQNSAGDIITQVGTIQMRVERESTLRHPEGLAIAQLVLITK